ncbi:hypothetical protein JTE90_016002 [Oedothorax gibbosus]|uniref:Uncharacterized protein n=1 Tax=Oedothorax gibbosus TaxID=931172 RepID=A0AAV6VTT5_9ARAC|nr:hypothetical protein JTE90_016002 [Oedothorax gibbosus]
MEARISRVCRCLTVDLPCSGNIYFTILLIGYLASCQSQPLTSAEGSTLIQEQAQQNYNHHQEVIQGHSSTSSNTKPNDGSFAITFDNHNKEHRDRGYGYEKAYAYSRETAFFDFYDDKPSINAKDLVEKYGDTKNEDLLKDIVQ